MNESWNEWAEEFKVLDFTTVVDLTFEDIMEIMEMLENAILSGLSSASL